MKSIDALIIGGGPAGAAAAILLAKGGWSVTLVERKEFPRRKVCGEYLSATNWPLFQSLGIADAFAEMAGPPVRETAVFAGSASARASLPRPPGKGGLWGRALSREHLDTLLLAKAIQRGVHVRQPARCVAVARTGDTYHCVIESHPQRTTDEVIVPIVIAAHGSWDVGELCTQRQQAPPHKNDLLAFKAHFQNAQLPPGLMPLISFPDGYGGMVHCDGGKVSLSCCIRRQRLERLSRYVGHTAGDAVLAHILDSCRILRPVLEPARIDGSWLSAGPIQPGVRRCYDQGLFLVGNAAGEAHPVVAEGISMAMQSAWLLAERLISQRGSIHHEQARELVARDYDRAWRRSFVPRIRAAAAVAQWAMRPRLVVATLPLLRSWPNLLTFGAWLSGKAKLVIQEDALRVTGRAPGIYD